MKVTRWSLCRYRSILASPLSLVGGLNSLTGLTPLRVAIVGLPVFQP